MPDDVISTWKAALEKGLRALEHQHQRRPLRKFVASIFVPTIIWDWPNILRCGKRCATQ